MRIIKVNLSHKKTDSGKYFIEPVICSEIIPLKRIVYIITCEIFTVLDWHAWVYPCSSMTFNVENSKKYCY